MARRKVAGGKAKLKGRKRCLHCECVAIQRGICNTCRAKINQAIAAGAFSEAEAVKEGLLLPSRQGMRSDTNRRSKIEQRIAQVKKSVKPAQRTARAAS